MKSEIKEEFIPGWEASWRRRIIDDLWKIDGGLTGTNGRAQKSILGGGNVMWVTVKAENMGMFGMQE